MKHLLALAFASTGIAFHGVSAPRQVPPSSPQCQPPVCAWVVTWHYPPQADRTFTEASLDAALSEERTLLSAQPGGVATIQRVT